MAVSGSTELVTMENKSPRYSEDDEEEEGEIEEEVRPPEAKLIARPGLGPSSMPGFTRTAKYIPPSKRKLLLENQRQEGDDAGEEALLLQRQLDTWKEQQRVVHGTINRLNSSTIKPLIQELFQKVNLIRLRGVLCKSVLTAAMSSPKYSNVYAALIAVVNTKLPEVGELAVVRSILAFRRHYKRREKASCLSVCIFLAHLFHQAVVHELLILQILSVLLDGDPTDDSVEVAVQLLQTSGQALLDVSPAGVRACLERLRALMHEGNLNKRVEYQMEKLLKQRKTGFKEFPPLIDDLDLVERDDQITHEITLDDEEIKREEELDTFRVDPDFEESEMEWKGIKDEILGGGDDSSSDDEDDDDDDDDEGSESRSNDQPEETEVQDGELQIIQTDATELQTIQDLTEQDLVHLRRTIYLTIMSSATFEECTHKLAKIDIPPGREMELINMLIECCSQERTFLRYYGLIAARFCVLDNRWRDAFMESFREQYKTIHRLETNKLRNVAKLFAHILHTDSIPWSVLECIHLNEDETTSSSRIFIKIIIQEIAEAMGIAKLKSRFESVDEEAKISFGGMFPKDNVRNTRYAINFFTSIGLGPLTDDLREFLKNAPKLILAKAKEAALAKKAEESDESSSVSSTSSSSSGSTSSSSRSSYSSTSSRSYSTSSSSSFSSSSYSRRRRRSNRRRKRSYSSSSQSSSSSSSYTRSREGGRRHQRGGKHSMSTSPPKEIITTDEETGRKERIDIVTKKDSSAEKEQIGGDRRRGRKRRDRSLSQSSETGTVDSSSQGEQRRSKKSSRGSPKRSRRESQEKVRAAQTERNRAETKDREADSR